MATSQDRLTEALRSDKSRQQSSHASPAESRSSPSQAYGGAMLRATGNEARSAAARKKKGGRSSSRY